MKKKHGLHRNILARAFVSIFMIFTLVAVLFPANLLAQNNQSNSITVMTTREVFQNERFK
jgi:hypothetical protein